MFGLSLNFFVQSQINQLKLMAPVILNAILKSLDSYPNLESGLSCNGAYSTVLKQYIILLLLHAVQSQ